MERGIRSITSIAVASAVLALLMPPSHSACAREPAVAGLNELVVYDPGTHERGLPAVQFAPSACGNLTVQIPPAVHVHRYYYNGDKEFQGPIIQGGPTIVVANHPDNPGCTLYIRVNLPSGTPRIAHNKSSITYVYANSRVVVKFSHCAQESAVVQHLSGQGFSRRAHAFHDRVKTRSHEVLHSLPLAQSIRKTGVEGGKLLNGARSAADSAAAELLDSIRGLAGNLPGVSALQSYAEQSPARAQLDSLRAAADRQTRSATEFFNTNR